MLIYRDLTGNPPAEIKIRSTTSESFRTILSEQPVAVPATTVVEEQDLIFPTNSGDIGPVSRIDARYSNITESFLADVLSTLFPDRDPDTIELTIRMMTATKQDQ